MAGTQNDRYYFVDMTGTRLRHIQIDMGVAYSDQIYFLSQPYTVKLISDDIFGNLEGNVHGCSIGGKKIPDQDVQLLLDGKSALAISRARLPFELRLKIYNRAHLTGAVFCESVAVLLFKK